MNLYCVWVGVGGWVVGFLSSVLVQWIRTRWDRKDRENEQHERRRKTRLAVYTELKTIHGFLKQPSAKLPEQLYSLLADSIKELPSDESEAILIVRAYVEQWNASFPESQKERMIRGTPGFPEELKESVSNAMKALEPNQAAA